MRVLVVEDNAEIREEIEDALFALGCEHDWAASQHEARELLKKNSYDCALVDLGIPARPGRGFAKIEHGRQLIVEMPTLAGRTVPIVVMTGYGREGLDLATELMRYGVVDFITKPLPETGRTLPRVFQDALRRGRAVLPKAVPTAPPQPFSGGTLTYFADNVELLGEPVLEVDGMGHGWDVMQALRKRRPSGKLPAYSGPQFARLLGDGVTESAVSSCIYHLRRRFTEVMLNRLNLACGKYDVIDNRGRGYRLNDWIIVEEHDGEAVQRHLPAAATVQPIVAGGGAPADRQAWIIERLRAVGRLSRADVETEFGIGAKQAKRLLSELTSQGRVQFVRKPHPGHYELVEADVAACADGL